MNNDLIICEEYISNKILPIDIVKKYNLKSLYHLNKILNKNDIKRMNRSELSKLINKTRNCGTFYSYNIDYFNNWSNNMSYILGFIAADGCIKNNGLRISLQGADFDILEKIKKELSYTGEIKYGLSKCQNKYYKTATLDICRKDLKESLEKHNITARKSFIIKMPDNIPEEFFISYIKGYFDGNGSVDMQYPGKTKTAQIRIRICSGSEILLTQFRDWLIKVGLKNVSIAKKLGIFEICYSTKNSLKLYELFYNNLNSIYLDRKKKIFDNCIKTRNNDLNRI